MEIVILNDDGKYLKQPSQHISYDIFCIIIYIYIYIYICIYFLIFSEPGNLQFEKRGYLVKESCGHAEIGVLRQNGADGNISVKWKTIDKSAVSGKDYNGGEGELKFGHGEVGTVIFVHNKNVVI